MNAVMPGLRGSGSVRAVTTKISPTPAWVMKIFERSDVVVAFFHRHGARAAGVRPSPGFGQPTAQHALHVCGTS